MHLISTQSAAAVIRRFYGSYWCGLNKNTSPCQKLSRQRNKIYTKICWSRETWLGLARLGSAWLGLARGSDGSGVEWSGESAPQCARRQCARYSRNSAKKHGDNKRARFQWKQKKKSATKIIEKQIKNTQTIPEKKYKTQRNRNREKRRNNTEQRAEKIMLK